MERSEDQHQKKRWSKKRLLFHAIE
jgi:hypothetical protein